MKRPARAVFLDRDGVIVREVGYLRAVERLEVLRGVPEAIKLLRRAGYKVVVVTNQSGIYRGYLTTATLHRLHRELKRRLARSGARWDALYFSPHGPDSGHPMRKPGTGMLRAAAKRFGLDLRACYLVGDRHSDVQCARNGRLAGAVVVRTGAGRRYKGPKPDVFRRDLLSAARWILARNDTK
ncbi:MAG: HAD family hydrolase [Elusimicrobiota bacterium]|nr:HAD family hydrolase [Elusimicrobiota bacterium]